MEQFVIRALSPQDRERIQEIIEQGGIFTREELRVALELLDIALDYPERDEYYALGAVGLDEWVVGYACFGHIPMMDRCFDLYWIAVDESCGRRGVGGRLLGRVETYVKARGARRIYVETSSTAPYGAARSFYDRHGFRVACVLTDFYRPGDDKMIYVKEM